MHRISRKFVHKCGKVFSHTQQPHLAPPPPLGETSGTHFCLVASIQTYNFFKRFRTCMYSVTILVLSLFHRFKAQYFVFWYPSNSAVTHHNRTAYEHGDERVCALYRDVKSCWSSGKEVFKTVHFQSKFLLAVG